MKRNAFTLVEIILVVAILGILAAIFIPRFGTLDTTAKNNADKSNIATINSMLELYKANTGSYPTLTVIGTDTAYFPEGPPKGPNGSNWVCPWNNSYVENTNNRIDNHASAY